MFFTVSNKANQILFLLILAATWQGWEGRSWCIYILKMRRLKSRGLA